MNWRKSIAVLSASLMMTNCGGGGTPPPAAPSPTPIPNVALQDGNTDCPNGTLLSYRDFGEAFLLAHCTVCHSSELAEDQRVGAPLAVNLDKAEYIPLWRAKMLKVASDKKATMPTGHAIPTAERNRFKEWLACGASISEDQLR